MRALICSGLVLIAIHCRAQDTARIRTTQAALDSAPTDSARVVALNNLCGLYAEVDPDKGLEYGYRSLALAERIGFGIGQAQVLTRIGLCLTRKSLFDSARVELDRSVAIARALKEPCYEAAALYGLGLNHQMLQENDKALALFTRVLKMEEGCPQQDLRSIRLFSIGTVYDGMKHYAEALPYYEEALTGESAAGDSSVLARYHIAVANMHAALGHHDKAREHYDASIECSYAVGDSLMIGYIHYNVGEMLKLQGDMPGAIERSSASLDMFRRLHRPAEEAHASIHLGGLFVQAERAREAEPVLRSALGLAERLGLMDDRREAMYYLAEALEQQGRDPEALHFFKRYMQAKDSSDVKARDAQLDELTTRFETEKKEKELLASQAREAQARALTDRLEAQRVAYIGGAIVLAALLLLFVSRYRLKRKAADDLQRVNAEVVRQKDRAEESERAKDRFLANVSHEIRTPLNAIMGFTGLLMHEHRDERSARYLSNIREAGDSLLVVINDVLDISRIEAGRLQLVKEPFDLHRAVRLCREILQHRAEEQGNALILEIAPDVPRWVTGDSARVLQILLNLAGNALKFTHQGEARIAVRATATGICMEVSDTGIGIPQDKLAGIFDRFSQVEVTDQRNHGGTGLGLAIVKELVDLQQGSIEVRSVVGQGTRFNVSLPLIETDAPVGSGAQHAEPSSRNLSGHVILVAEDNEMNALVTTETLRRHYPDCKSVVVRTGQEAIDRIEADEDRDIALVLMDVQMPVMDGMTATRRIRALNDDRARLPVIALTASVLPSDLSKCLDAGMDACVSKPFKADELLDAIARLTGDRGTPAGVGYDVHDPHVALFHWLVPPRLKALRIALENERADEVKRIVHALRPQLVERDAHFAALCDLVLSGNGDQTAAAGELAAAIENALR